MKRRFASLACVLSLITPGFATALVPSSVRADPIAFPGAEGAGRHALGGRGGRVLRVTTLADSGPGSLRAAVEADGPRVVVFDTGGTIRLLTPLKIRHGRITVAGQTAPGGGVTVRGQPFVVAADDVVVRHMRSRLGDESGAEADAISIERGRRIILDHVSASWSVDETLSVGSRYDPPEQGIYDVTVQWSIIAESLNRSGHAKGEHGYGSLIRGGHGSHMTFHHNLWASHRARMPRPGNYGSVAVDPVGPRLEFRDNVFFNWGQGHAGYNDDTQSRADYAFIGNAYLPGPDSRGTLAFRDANPLARAWFEANAMNGVAPVDPWSLVREPSVSGYRFEVRPNWAESNGGAPADTLIAVLAHAGARRDSVDARIVEGVRSRTGRIIDSQVEVGGWPVLDPGTPWVDTDGDGMPDDWEVAHGLDPTSTDDGARDRNGDGYTNLEDWLNAVADAAQADADSRG